jgi:hypothetical protein
VQRTVPHRDVPHHFCRCAPSTGYSIRITYLDFTLPLLPPRSSPAPPSRGPSDNRTFPQPLPIPARLAFSLLLFCTARCWLYHASCLRPRFLQSGDGEVEPDPKMSAPTSSSGARAPSGAVASSSSNAEATRPASGETTGSSSSAAVTAASSSSASRRHGQQGQTLHDVMRAPSSTLPDVVVLDSLPEGLNRKEVLDPKEDLWLSTADG